MLRLLPPIDSRGYIVDSNRPQVILKRFHPYYLLDPKGRRPFLHTVVYGFTLNDTAKFKHTSNFVISIFSDIRSTLSVIYDTAYKQIQISLVQAT